MKEYKLSRVAQMVLDPPGRLDQALSWCKNNFARTMLRFVVASENFPSFTRINRWNDLGELLTYGRSEMKPVRDIVNSDYGQMLVVELPFNDIRKIEAAWDARNDFDGVPDLCRRLAEKYVTKLRELNGDVKPIVADCLEASTRFTNRDGSKGVVTTILKDLRMNAVDEVCERLDRDFWRMAFEEAQKRRDALTNAFYGIQLTSQESLALKNGGTISKMTPEIMSLKYRGAGAVDGVRSYIKDGVHYVDSMSELHLVEGINLERSDRAIQEIRDDCVEKLLTKLVASKKPTVNILFDREHIINRLGRKLNYKGEHNFMDKASDDFDGDVLAFHRIGGVDATLQLMVHKYNQLVTIVSRVSPQDAQEFKLDERFKYDDSVLSDAVLLCYLDKIPETVEEIKSVLKKIQFLDASIAEKKKKRIADRARVLSAVWLNVHKYTAETYLPEVNPVFDELDPTRAFAPPVVMLDQIASRGFSKVMTTGVIDSKDPEEAIKLATERVKAYVDNVFFGE